MAKEKVILSASSGRFFSDVQEETVSVNREKVILNASASNFFSEVNEEVIKRGLDSRDWLTKASIAIMVVSNVLTFLVILFQGFKFYDFSLPEPFLHWLGGATIGTLIANTTVLYKHLYKETIFTTGAKK